MTYKLLLFAGVTAVLAVSFGCNQAAPPTPPDTRAADEQAIRDSEAAWTKEYNAKDAEKVFAHYADDASSMIPDTPLMTGKAAIRAGQGPEFADPNFALDFHPTQVEVSKSGDLAYTQGVTVYTSTDPKTKKVVVEKGNYVEVYRKQPDGTWKVIEDIATEEAPPAPLKTTK
jgi:uncharacterized protein (TIGR02246 family)